MQRLVKSQSSDILNNTHRRVIVKSPDQLYRQANTQRCKQLARAARGRSGVTLDEIAGTLHVSLRQAKRLFQDDECQLTYADLHLLAKDPGSAEFVRDLLAHLLELVDPRNLRLADIDQMSRTGTGASGVLAFLKSTVERLEPVQNLSDTREVAE